MDNLVWGRGNSKALICGQTEISNLRHAKTTDQVHPSHIIVCVSKKFGVVGVFVDQEMAARRITHVIFDCDGLLLDTEGVYTTCIQTIVGRYGKTFDWNVKKAMMGRRLLEASQVALEMMQVPLTAEEFVGEHLDCSVCLSAESQTPYVR
jgi:hypothetical protein